MGIGAHTSERTSVGYVLQLLTDEALRRAKKKFVPNAKYHENFIMPDALIPGIPPEFSVHVTCTGGDDSFRMKRWRYVDEVLQMRSVYGNTFVAINVMFGPLLGYRVRDRELVRRLFDTEIVVEDLPNGLHLYGAVVAAVGNSKPGQKSREIADQVLIERKISNTIDSLAAAMDSILKAMPTCRHSTSDVEPLVSYLMCRKRGLPKVPGTPGHAFWKRSLLRFLAVNPDQWPIIFGIKGRRESVDSISPELLSRGKQAKLLVEKKGLLAKIALPGEIEVTIDSGLTLPFLKDLETRVANDPRRQYELSDLWDDGARAQSAIREFVKAVTSGRRALSRMIEHSLLHGGSPKLAHHRAHVLDIVIVVLGASQTRLQDGYAGPEIGVKNPIQNLIPRTEIALQAIAKDSGIAGRIADALTNQIWEDLEKVDLSDVQALSQLYIDYRIYCLTKGSSIDPLETFVEESCTVNGWSQASPGIECVHPIVGKTKTVFSAAATKGSKRLLVKCLFGDTGADHKAEEMEARMRIIRTCANPWQNAHCIFVADGKWSPGHVTALRLGGWDDVIAVSEFNDCVAEL